jgi:predicted N-acetyltransferase YhbS
VRPTLRAMAESDLDAVDRLNRLAFGTFFKLADPMAFRGDGDGVRTRFRSGLAIGIVAEAEGEIVGAGMGSLWGSFGLLGPVMVEPARWGQGVAHALVPALVEALTSRGCRGLGLFTHPGSPSHVRLYESAGFRLDAVHAFMAKPVAARATEPELLSGVAAQTRDAVLAECRALCDAAHPGLDASREIACVDALGLGETVLLRRAGALAGFAVCHAGRGSEIGGDGCLVKLAFVRPGAAEELRALLAACEALAGRRGAARIVAATSAARGAYDVLRALGYRSFMNGVAMLRPGGPAFNRPEIFALDDWR